jgi:hypothetical protein
MGRATLQQALLTCARTSATAPLAQNASAWATMGGGGGAGLRQHERQVLSFQSLTCPGCSFGGVPIMALTATATDACRADVIKVLRMASPQVFQVGLLCLAAWHPLLRSQRCWRDGMPIVPSTAASKRL